MKRKIISHASDGNATSRGAKKARHNYTEANAQTAKIFENLSSNDPGARLEAAQKLSQKYSRNAILKSDLSHVEPDKEADKDQAVNFDDLKQILSRLMRGLCSSRNSARHGFYVALTELCRTHADSQELRPKILKLLTRSTTIDQGTSTQEERDYEVGRLIGLSAILHSELFLRASVEDTGFRELIDAIICSFNRLPWLREDCGHLLVEAVRLVAKHDPQRVKTAKHLVTLLANRDFSHTPEGLALWIEINTTIPDVRLPKNVWHHRNPLNRKEISTVAEIMRRHKGCVSNQGSKAVQKSSTGARQDTLHFAWGVVVETLIKEGMVLPEEETLSKKSSFYQFWEDAVEHGYLAPSSSLEKKSLGLQAVRNAVHFAPPPALDQIVGLNLVTCLVNQGSEPQRYLHGAAQSVTDSLISRARVDQKAGRRIFLAILGSEVSWRFDRLTKTRTLQDIILSTDEDELNDDSSFILSILDNHLKLPQGNTPNESEDSLRIVADCLLQLVKVRGVKRGTNENELQPWVKRVIVSLAQTSCSVDWEKPRAICRLRLLSCLGHVYSLVPDLAGNLLEEVVRMLLSNSDSDGKATWNSDFEPSVMLEQATRRIIERSVRILDEPKDGIAINQAVRVLLSVTLIEVLSGDLESTTLLEELQNIHQDLQQYASTRREAIDAVIEITLSFASRQSAFNRKLSEHIFTVFAKDMSQDALHCMLEIFDQKENHEGQKALFSHEEEDGVAEIASENDNDNTGYDAEDAPDDSTTLLSDHGEDVKPHGPSEPSASESDEPESETGSSSSELARLDQALASTLGSSTYNNQPVGKTFDSSSDSDISMTDSQMLALEPHITEIFRQRATIEDQRDKAKGRKDTPKKRAADGKRNMLNLKNRVLDFLTIWLKQAHDNPLTLQVLLPLLRLMRTTNTKQISERGSTLLRTYFEAAKKKGMPVIRDERNTEEDDSGLLWALLEAVHEEALLFPSKTHAATCSRASLFLARCLMLRPPDSLSSKDSQEHGNSYHRRYAERKQTLGKGGDSKSAILAIPKENLHITQRIWRLYNETGMRKLSTCSGLPESFWNEWIGWVFAKRT